MAVFPFLYGQLLIISERGNVRNCLLYMIITLVRRMFASLFYISLILIQLLIKETSSDVVKKTSPELNYCRKATKDINSPCFEKNLEYPISADDLQLLKQNSLSIETQSCPNNPSLTCVSLSRQSLIGAGTYGLVVRGQSKNVHFPVAIKFIKIPAKLDIVSFNTKGRYNHIDLNSLAENKGNEKSLREAVALRVLTEYDVPSVPKYVAYFETSSYRILAMEFLDGYEELSSLIDQLPPKDLQLISCQTATIVCNLDQLGVSHDDMHERNILINRQNKNIKVYLIDFGGAHFNGKQGHFTSTGNFFKQPINFLGHLKRLIKEDLIDLIQSQEKKELGRFCSMMQKYVNNDKVNLAYHYQVLFDKYWKISQTNKKLFKCVLNK